MAKNPPTTKGQDKPSHPAVSETIAEEIVVSSSAEDANEIGDEDEDEDAEES
ncbi:hypothetical protein QBC46DRAFT_347979 [Diplogelasinospora grovesii]|uniref:Uncharacterized protein n=1 Tax=Diplogelasinospora grovesii TaxID=303347 RepID=A0AAN6RZE5_9PEZI|nr:hypothetical protein QBC46DRAFT_347979 [Diplogelasinospora grovesii]